MSEAAARNYHRPDVVVFRRTGEAFGGLSNMAPGFPIEVLGHRIRTAEALYQACRFPHLPDVQRMIIDEASPMTAKMRSKPYRQQSRPDWDEVRVPIMKWCLRMKLAANWPGFSALLLSTGDRSIVEDSRKDDFWGARPCAEHGLSGRNVLGRLLMELREKLRADPDSLRRVNPVPIPDFRLLNHAIGVIEARAATVPGRTIGGGQQTAFL
ncbi:MAG: NADAR family protein [Sphingomonadales bacterium]|nr:NADAR family protein [Sphingomonadales bacterium]